MQQVDIDRFDTLISNYMNTQNITGLSFAITKNERLVYAKSYGYSDAYKGMYILLLRDKNGFVVVVVDIVAIVVKSSEVNGEKN